MKDSVSLKWIDNLAFEAAIDGHKMIIDAKPEVGGTDRGPRPKPLMMVSLAGCTGMDVASLLKKMRIEFEQFNVKVEAEITEEHPKHFTSMHIIYELKGRDLPLDKIERAVELSQNRYCGVTESYRKVMKLTYEIRLV
jgi:putative redox protein